MTQIELARQRIQFAREYTHKLLDKTDVKDWYRIPQAGVSHIAWQMGHMAISEYRLALERLRGVLPDDQNLITERFLRAFGRVSVPDADVSRHLPVEELRSVFDRVHAQVLKELLTFTDADLEEPVLKPHALAKTKGESLFWCAHHEGVHTGHIGLLRRQLGYDPVW
jgi:hypothetical protein